MANTNKNTLQKMFSGFSLAISLALIAIIVIGLYSSIRNDWQSDNGSEYAFYGGIIGLIGFFLLTKYLDVPGR